MDPKTNTQLLSDRKDQPNSRASRLKEIDELYNTQIKQIYRESQQATKQKQKIILDKKERFHSPNFNSAIKSSNGLSMKRVLSNQNILKSDIITTEEQKGPNRIGIAKNEQFLSKNNLLGVRDSKNDEEKVRASTYLQGQSTRTIQILRKQIQSKQMKIRELVSKCQNLTEKLRMHLSPQQLENQLENIRQYSDKKMQRLQNLLKIKNQQIFFKMKVQIIGLLQQFQVSRQEIDGIKEVSNESSLFSFMVRKLKLKLKDIRTKQSQNSQKIQKDNKINQHFEDRINYLTETNELLKLTEMKLKNKIQDLKNQLNQYIDRIKDKQLDVEERQNQIFRLKKQNQQLQSINQKMNHAQKNTLNEKTDEKKIFQVRQKEMTSLLNSYYLQRKKLQNLLEEKQGEIQQILIRQKFLQTQNQRLNRQYVRWKQRYEWIQKEKQNRQKEYQEQKDQILQEFQDYKQEHNQSVQMTYKVQLDQSIRKIQAYQNEVQKLMTKLQQQRKNNSMREQQHSNYFQNAQRQWLDKFKQLQQTKQNQIFQIQQDHQIRLKEQREQFQKKQQLLVSEMQARMKALLAENDKKSTQQLIQIENQNDELKRQIQIMKQHMNTMQAYGNSLKKKLSSSENPGDNY